MADYKLVSMKRKKAKEGIRDERGVVHNWAIPPSTHVIKGDAAAKTICNYKLVPERVEYHPWAIPTCRKCQGKVRKFGLDK